MRLRRSLAAVVLVGGWLLVACAGSSDSVPRVEAVPTGVPTALPSAVPTEPLAPEPAAGPIVVAYGDEPDQFGRLSLPAAPSEPDLLPVVVLIHGGFWQHQFDLSLMDSLADDLSAEGYAVWNIEYRRVGPGGAGGWPATGDDVGAAIDHLAELAAIYSLDLERVVLVGHSAGGHLALWAASRPDATVSPVGAVGLGAVVDPSLFPQAQSLLGGSPADAPEAYAAASPDLDPGRMVLVHGAADRIIPFDTLASAQDAGVEILVIANENHFDLIDPASQSWEATRSVIASFQ